MITRAALKGHELSVFESKLTAVGFGFFVPFFFVTSGLQFDLNALGSSSALSKLALFLCLFVIVRGTPAVLLYRGVLSMRERAAFAFYCATELPLVVAITTLAIAAGHMRHSTAAGLVGAAMLSTLIFPFVGLALKKRADLGEGEGPGDSGQAPALAWTPPVVPRDHGARIVPASSSAAGSAAPGELKPWARICSEEG